jgi:hypothetical protein
VVDPLHGGVRGKVLYWLGKPAPVTHRALLHSLVQDSLKLRIVTEKEPTESTKGTPTAWLMADDSKVSKALRRMQIDLYLHGHYAIQVNSASRVGMLGLETRHIGGQGCTCFHFHAAAGPIESQSSFRSMVFNHLR